MIAEEIKKTVTGVTITRHFEDGTSKTTKPMAVYIAELDERIDDAEHGIAGLAGMSGRFISDKPGFDYVLGRAALAHLVMTYVQENMDELITLDMMMRRANARGEASTPKEAIDRIVAMLGRDK